MSLAPGPKHALPKLILLTALTYPTLQVMPQGYPWGLVTPGKASLLLPLSAAAEAGVSLCLSRLTATEAARPSPQLLQAATALRAAVKLLRR